MAKYKGNMVNVDEHAKAVALEAVRLFRQEEKEKAKKSSLHNIGLLMDHYLELVDHYENIKYRATDISDELDLDALEEVAQDDIIIHSIKRSKIRTQIIISQVSTAVRMLETEMKAKEELDKFNAFQMLYLDKEIKDLKFTARVRAVAESIHCGDNTVRRWNTEMLNKLAIKLFGVDGLRLDV